jgi:hypothetical protein
VGSNVINPFLPGRESLFAESAPTVDEFGLDLPGFHMRQKLRAVHQLQVLSKMIFPVECASL